MEEISTESCEDRGEIKGKEGREARRTKGSTRTKGWKLGEGLKDLRPRPPREVEGRRVRKRVEGKVR